MDRRHMWQGILTIKDPEKIASHIAFTNATLPEELNMFFSRFEHNDPELLRRVPDDNVGYTPTALTDPWTTQSPLHCTMSLPTWTKGMHK